MAGWLVASDVDHTLLEQPDEAALAGECLRRLQRLTTLLGELRAQLGLRFSLLGELSTAEVEQQLGLTKPLARLALQRLASQPLIWRDGEEELMQLRQQLAGHGLTAVWGGRLLHIAPPGGKG
jgi:mannosyl-3-phosphoglycerate phosphatase